MRTYCLTFLLIIGSLWSYSQEITIDPLLDTLQLDEDNWTYPWYIVKHERGFENTLGEGISSADTLHLVENAKCQVEIFHWRRQVPCTPVSMLDSTESVSRLPFAKAEWKGDTLTLSIWQESASDNQILTLFIVDQQLRSDYAISYVQPSEDWQVRILKQSLQFYEVPVPGRPIKAKVDIVLEEQIRWSSIKIDKIFKTIQGTFVIE